MNLRPWPLVASALLAGAAAAQTSAPAAAPAAAAAPSKSAADACEDAVAQTVRDTRGRAVQEVQFVGAKRSVTTTSDDETAVKGAGRWRSATGSVPFTYSCTYNTKTQTAGGALFRETGPLPAAAAAKRGGSAARGDAAWQPDLTNLSPEACESATVAELKRKYPRVGRVAFGSDSRVLSPAGDGRTQLEGQGAVARAAGMNAVPFSYRCELDTKSGRVLSVSTVERVPAGASERLGASAARSD